MLTIRQARTIAKAIVQAQAVHDAQLAANHISEAIALGGEKTELVIKYVGLEYKLAQKRLRVCNDIDCGKPTSSAALQYGVMWSRTIWESKYGESNSTRYYVQGEANARALAGELKPTRNESDYSPTGLWFRGSPSVHVLRGNIWIVQTSSHLDC